VKLDRQSIGSRYVEVYRVPKSDLTSYLTNKMQQRGGSFGAGVGMVGSGTDFFIKVRMSRDRYR
jgi:hypothetical protein